MSKQIQLHFATFSVVFVGVLSFLADTEGSDLIQRLSPFKKPVPELAAKIDKIERELQYTGRVTVKAPDVWGQARLTAHRREFEEQMAAQLETYQETRNAQIAVSDQAFLSQALALSAAANGGTLPTINFSEVQNSSPFPAAVAGGGAQSKVETKSTIYHSEPFGLADKSGSTTLALEPEVQLDQRKRFLDHLHEIRRVNEGDDTSDSPGYSLNLVRVPVSILPGDKTRENFGAEVTLIAEPYVSEELLPETFRDLVIKDLVDQLSMPVVKIIEQSWSTLQKYETYLTGIDVYAADRKLDAMQAVPSFQALELDIARNIEKYRDQIGLQTSRDRRSRYPVATSQLSTVFGTTGLTQIAFAVFRARDRQLCRDRVQLTDVQGILKNELEYAYDFLGSQKCMDPATGSESDLWFGGHVPTASDVRTSTLIIGRRKQFFESLMSNLRFQKILFPKANGSHNSTSSSDSHSDVAETCTEALAWAVLVESVLLNEQLNIDVQRVSRDPNCECVMADPQVFYGPHPDPVAKQVFAEYVKCRWPVRVFALDPVVQQQNVNDAFSLRREMQMSLALAFSQQSVNAQSVSRYMRRIEQDIRTIALNNTHVAFGAGNDTFGWRFYPRVQTPGVESNLTVIARDLVWGGPNKDQLLKQWRIEPGMRECVALVVMPSFVKHLRFDVRTNWFKLVPSPATKMLHTANVPASMLDTMEWSKLIRSMEDSVMKCMKDEQKYRNGEVERLLKRAEQLSNQLPLNTMYAQVPNENNLGGFEMFSAGVTDLAPELVGFHGAPGIDPERETVLFLVGNNFSVHRTDVIAGNQPLKSYNMLSREVLQITIPRHPRIDRRLCQERTDHTVCCNEDCNDLYVEVRVATPYGVSSALHIPVVSSNGWGQGKSPLDVKCPSVSPAEGDGAGALLNGPTLCPLPPAPTPEVSEAPEEAISPISYESVTPLLLSTNSVAEPLPPEIRFEQASIEATLNVRVQSTDRRLTLGQTKLNWTEGTEFVIWSPKDRALSDGAAVVRLYLLRKQESTGHLSRDEQPLVDITTAQVTAPPDGFDQGRRIVLTTSQLTGLANALEKSFEKRYGQRHNSQMPTAVRVKLTAEVLQTRDRTLTSETVLPLELILRVSPEVR